MRDPFALMDTEAMMVPMKSVLLLIEQLCPACQATARAILVGEIPLPNRFTDPTSTPSLEQIVGDIARDANLSIELVILGGRTPKVVDARRRIAVVARQHGYSIARIADFLGKHHTTICHLLETAKDATSRLTPPEQKA